MIHTENSESASDVNTISLINYILKLLRVLGPGWVGNHNSPCCLAIAK